MHEESGVTIRAAQENPTPQIPNPKKKNSFRKTARSRLGVMYLTGEGTLANEALGRLACLLFGEFSGLE